jgi:hypothetical protein
LDVSFDLSCDNFENKIDILKKNRIGSSCIRIVDYLDNKFKVGFLLSHDEELIFSCSSITFEGDNSNILNNKWIDLGKAWDEMFENNE